MVNDVLEEIAEILRAGGTCDSGAIEPKPKPGGILKITKALRIIAQLSKLYRTTSTSGHSPGAEAKLFLGRGFRGLKPGPIRQCSNAHLCLTNRAELVHPLGLSLRAQR